MKRKEYLSFAAFPNPLFLLSHGRAGVVSSQHPVGPSQNLDPVDVLVQCCHRKNLCIRKLMLKNLINNKNTYTVHLVLSCIGYIHLKNFRCRVYVKLHTVSKMIMQLLVQHWSILCQRYMCKVSRLSASHTSPFCLLAEIGFLRRWQAQSTYIYRVQSSVWRLAN